MKISKRQLKQFLRESFHNILLESTSHPEKGECPDQYDWGKLYSLTKSMRIRGYGEPTTPFLKAWNRYKKKGMNIPGLLYDDVPECAYAVIEAASKGGYDMSDDAYQTICDAWIQDANNRSAFDWNYDPDDY